MSTAATRAMVRTSASRVRVPARATRLSARPRLSSTAALRESAPRHLGNTARAAVVPVSARGRADEAEPGWYDVPATSNFIDVRSEEELRDVMRAAYGNERASTLLVVEFYGKWCNSCRRLYPRLRRLAEQEQDVLFCKIDFDACKDLCRKLGVVKLPYFHVYNGSGSRLADFAASLDPAKFKRLTDAVAEHRAPRCALKERKGDASDSDRSPSLVKLHHVTINWYGGGTDVQIAGDVAGGWTHTLAMRATERETVAAADSERDAEVNGVDGSTARARRPERARQTPTHAVTAILPTGTYRFKFIRDGAWVTADAHYPVVTDGAGNANNEVFVGAASWPFEWVRVPSAAPAGPPGRAENIPVALTEVRSRDAPATARPDARRGSSSNADAAAAELDPARAPRGTGSSLSARREDSPRVGAESSYLVRQETRKEKSTLAAPVSPGVARVEAAGARAAASTPFDPALAKRPPGEAGEAATSDGNTADAAETWPRQIKVSADDFSTRSEHEAKVREETAQAFLALEFRRKEARQAARENRPLGPYSAVSVAPSSAPVPMATPAPATRADLLTLEDRVRRLETILENHGIGVEDGWLREG